jgi:hypothetical protein
LEKFLFIYRKRHSNLRRRLKKNTAITVTRVMRVARVARVARVMKL